LTDGVRSAVKECTGTWKGQVLGVVVRIRVLERVVIGAVDEKKEKDGIVQDSEGIINSKSCMIISWYSNQGNIKEKNIRGGWQKQKIVENSSWYEGL